jgi:hypothetical protein
MNITTAYSIHSDPLAATQEVAATLAAQLPGTVLYFASSNYAAPTVAGAMERAFPGATVIGCTTAGELVGGHMLKSSLVAMALPSEIVPEIHVQVVHNIGTSLDGVDAAFRAFSAATGTSALELDPSSWVGLILIDGLSRAEERVMERIGALTDVMFIGGSAGDDLKFARTEVFAAGQAHSDAAVLALLRVPHGFDFIKTQSFCAMNKILTPTLVDEATRTVLEFDGQPAAQAYAAALGLPVEEAAKHFMDHPLGLMDGDEPYVRSPQQITGNAMAFYCAVKAGMPLSVLDSSDIIADTAQALAEKTAALGQVAGVVNFNCILRTLELDAEGKAAEYGAVFAKVPTVGFSTYGEAMIGHINQTSTMLVFKA